MLGVVHDSANPNSPFAKLKVRQALQHAIDGEAMAKTIYLGEAEAAKEWIYKGQRGWFLWERFPSFAARGIRDKKINDIIDGDDT
jgi:ABC-type transport system substrate-binding protein